MITVDFKPSQVVGMYLQTEFNNHQKETWATVIADLLTKENDEWKEFSFPDLLEAFRVCEVGIVSGSFILFQANPDFWMNQLMSVVSDGYLELEDRNEVSYFKVTDKMLAFYANYSK